MRQNESDARVPQITKIVSFAGTRNVDPLAADSRGIIQHDGTFGLRAYYSDATKVIISAGRGMHNGKSAIILTAANLGGHGSDPRIVKAIVSFLRVALTEGIIITGSAAVNLAHESFQPAKDEAGVQVHIPYAEGRPGTGVVAQVFPKGR